MRLDPEPALDHNNLCLKDMFVNNSWYVHSLKRDNHRNLAAINPWLTAFIERLERIYYYNQSNRILYFESIHTHTQS